MTKQDFKIIELERKIEILTQDLSNSNNYIKELQKDKASLLEFINRLHEELSKQK